MEKWRFKHPGGVVILEQLFEHEWNSGRLLLYVNLVAHSFGGTQDISKKGMEADLIPCEGLLTSFSARVLRLGRLGITESMVDYYIQLISYNRMMYSS